MRKPLLLVVMGIVMSIALCACGGGTAGTPAAESADSGNGEAASTESADTESTGAEAAADVQTDQAYYKQLVEQYIDMSQYKDLGADFDSDYQLSEPLESVEVAGKTLRFDMTFDEVMSALGSDITVPAGLEDAETRGERILVHSLSPFMTADGLRFYLEFVGDEGASIKESTLAGVENDTSDPASITVEGVTMGSSVADVVAALGNPSSIGGAYTGGSEYLRFVYDYDVDDGSTKLLGASRVELKFDHDSVISISTRNLVK